MFDIKKMLKSRKAQVGTMELVVSVTIGLIVLGAIYSLAPVIGDKIEGSVTLQEDVAATGTLTFSGNTSDGETVNISTGCYEFVISGGPTPGNHPVNVGAGNNSSSMSATLLSAEIETVDPNVGSSVDGSVVTLTADGTGSDGNSITTTELCDNAVFGAATLTGGTDASEWSGSDVPTGVDIWKDNATLISLVVLVMIISLAIFYIRRMGGGGGGEM
jgi:hypothetical protein